MIAALKTVSVSFLYPGLLLIFLLIIAYFATSWFFKPVDKYCGKIEYSIFFFIRYFLISLLVLLFFRPEFKWEQSNTEYKKHLILFDNSSSVGLSDKSYPLRMKNLVTELLSKKEYENSLMPYAFGDSAFKISDTAFLKFNDRFTDLSGAVNLKEISSELKSKKIASILVVTDGLFNRGENPLNMAIECPVYTSLVGKADSSVDLSIQEVVFNEIASSEKDNKWEIVLGYSNSGKHSFPAELLINKDKKFFSKQTVTIPAGSGNLRLTIDPGLPQNKVAEISLSIKSEKQEKNYYNNITSHYQKMADNNDKVLIISSVLSLDFYFLSSLLKKNSIPFDRIDASTGFSDTRNTQYKAAIILSLPNDLPDKFSEQIINSANGILFFLNSSTSLVSAAKVLQTDLPGNAISLSTRLQDNKNSNSDFLYNFSNKQLSLKSLPEIRFLTGISLPKDRYAPIFDCIYQNNFVPGGWISINEESKLAILNIEDFWRLFFEINNLADNDQASNFLLNLLEYLGIEGNKQRLTVNATKNSYFTGELQQFFGKYYDRNFKEQTNERIRVRLKDRKEEIWLNYLNDKYSGSLTITEPGFYEYTVEVIKDGQILTQKQGSFKIVTNSLELKTLNPDSSLLKALTDKHHGQAIDQDSILQWIDSQEKVIIKENKTNYFLPTTSLYYFLLIILLFTTEWLWRKVRDF